MAYEYDRYISVNGGRDISSQITQCTFDISPDGGCITAALQMDGVSFNDFMDLSLGDTVEISYKPGTPYWYGRITGMSTSLSNGLSIQCSGISQTDLAECDPSGLFGTLAGITIPASVTSEQLEDGALGDGLHEYYIFAGDDLGFLYHATDLTRKTTQTISMTGTPEYAPATCIKVSCANVERATRYRIFKAFYADMIGAAIGEGHVGVGSATRFYYTDVAAPEFHDDGTFDWEACEYLEAIPTAPTHRAKGIVSNDVIDIVKHLADTYFPDLYNAAKITSGTGIEVSELDLDNDDASLLEVLETLAGIAGNVMYGVDAENEIFFMPRGTTIGTKAQIEARILKTFVIGEQYNLTTMVPDNVTDILTEATRTASREGATEIQTVPVVEARAYTTQRRLLAYGESIGMDEYTGGILPMSPMNDTYRTRLGVNTATPLPQTASEFFAAYPTASAIEAVYPGLAWLHRVRAAVGDEILGTYLKLIANTMQTTTAKPYNGSRRRGVVLVPSGVSREEDTARFAINTASRVGSASGQWSISVTRCEIQYSPSGLVAIRSRRGQRYVLEIQSIAFSFEEDVVVTISAGELDIHAMAKRHAEKAYRKNVTQAGLPTRIGIGDPALMAARAVDAYWATGKCAPSPIGLSASGGRANVAAPIDHAHSFDKDALNSSVLRLMMPNIERVFTVATFSDLALMVTKGNAKYVRGLQFRKGDLAIAIDTVTKYQYIGENGSLALSWMPLSIVTATDKASLPTVPNGAKAQTTGTDKRAYERINGAWICTSNLEA